MAILAEDDDVRVETRSDELVITSKRTPPDTVKLRLRSRNHNIGTVSFDAQDATTGQYLEVGYLKMERDERYRAEPSDLTSMIECWLRRFAPGGADDAEYVRVLRMRHDRIEPLVPLRVALRAMANGRLVCAESGGNEPLIANRDAVGPWETFEIVAVE